ncbi:hypothetical protein [Sinomonas humi]|uniref:Uncharacterized protein n=1 Tax=Sinomonas humi TaxID=1338436 RepID=A0A0B2AQQ1_9MICC|nr:hypothetical protein [Sinomonas humi]KHL04188.1 hypothetical protein LK10_06435 [Sinomonas humi]
MHDESAQKRVWSLRALISEPTERQARRSDQLAVADIFSNDATEVRESGTTCSNVRVDAETDRAAVGGRRTEALDRLVIFGSGWPEL